MFDVSVNHGVGRGLGWLAETRGWRVIIAHRLPFCGNLETVTTLERGWTRRVAPAQRYAAETYRYPNPAERALVVLDERWQLLPIRLGARGSPISSS